MALGVGREGSSQNLPGGGNLVAGNGTGNRTPEHLLTAAVA